MSDVNSEPRKMNLAIYLVGYFDMMGQKEHLGRLKPFAKTEEDYLEISNAVGTYAATILQIRDEISDFGRRAAVATSRNLDHLPPQSIEQFKRMTVADVRISGISDCFVMAANLSSSATFQGPEAWAKAAHSIQLVLLGLAGMQLKALASKIPIRGAVEVGLAMDLTETEIYGRALSDAVNLEETLAEYPRIMIGHELVQMLQWIASRDPDQSVASGFAVSQARNCIQRLISGTDDGHPVVHFLSDLLLEIDLQIQSAPGESLRDFRRDAEAWTHNEEARFAAANNQKLRARYHRLGRYFGAYPWAVN